MRRTLLTVGLGLTLALGSGLGLTGCASHQATLYQLSADQLLSRGMAAYDAHHWQKAIEYLARLAVVAPTHPRIGEIRFKLGQAHYNAHEYITAASEFSRLANEMAQDSMADDAWYGVCRSYDALSPDPQLDQEYTKDAIQNCQTLVQIFPNSPYADSAKHIVRAMTDKLARKVYEGGDWYYRRKALDSAIVYFEAVVNKYPDSPSAPRSLLRLYQIYQKLDYQEEMASTKAQLLKDYPDSGAAKQLRATDVVADTTSGAAGGR
ncbi:MAG TPA: outer membrane protein assembly factor BamD [Longimicrobiales bacterium]|nr:outer membrane protein assembly factor BamD [Longimicrobiales bacterium]